MPAWQESGFALYIHWPFCLAKCPYCDFNSHVASNISHHDWAQAYVHEIAQWGAILPERTLSSIYFGGGTPSLMEPETVDAVIRAARAAWPVSNTLEVSLEANPTSVERTRFQAFAAAGVNRLSLGIQSLDDTALRLLGRQHTVADALRAWDVANAVFQSCSFDLIYARQFQDLANWKAELDRAVALAPTHLSLYQLTIENGTAFGDRYKIGRLPGLPSEDLGADLYLATQEICEAAGLPAYEISNHAKPGSEGRHNLTYWRYGDYVGIGPGAHGRIEISGRKYATEAPRAPSSWLAASDRREQGIESGTMLTTNEAAEEYLMMSLRLAEGSDLNRIERLGAAPPVNSVIDSLIEQGLVWRQDSVIGATSSGRPLLNGLLRALLA